MRMGNAGSHPVITTELEKGGGIAIQCCNRCISKKEQTLEKYTSQALEGAGEASVQVAVLIEQNNCQNACVRTHTHTHTHTHRERQTDRQTDRQRERVQNSK